MQLYNWIYTKFVLSFDDMSDISKLVREELKSNYTASGLSVSDIVSGSGGESVKFLLSTRDGNFIESVLIYRDDIYSNDADSKITLCVSSQAGCPLGCAFCATARAGYKRNLDTGEIISQVLLAEKYISLHGVRKISNIVFMGMGEPLLNYDNVIKAVHILNFHNGYNLGSRHFTISTAGIIPGIMKLADEKSQIRLAVSLHTADQGKRASIMPVSVKYPLPLLIKALKHYQEKTGRRITFEYVLMEGLNDSAWEAGLLKEILRDFQYNLNIIPYNPSEGIPFKTPAINSIRAFTSNLKRFKIPYVLRKSKGSEISAACGQLGLHALRQ